MLRIGVTGPMASGKSAVARRFQAKGAVLVDGDALGWGVLRRPEVREALVRAFGAEVSGPGGGIDRAVLGRVVFRDPGAMARLNAIVQPPLLYAVRAELNRARNGIVVLDAAMLTTWALEPELDGVVLTTAPAAERVRRLMAARGMDEEEARARIEGQSLPPVRGARRLWEIENIGDEAALERKADAVWSEIETLARA